MARQFTERIEYKNTRFEAKVGFEFDRLRATTFEEFYGGGIVD